MYAKFLFLINKDDRTQTADCSERMQWLALHVKTWSREKKKTILRVRGVDFCEISRDIALNSTAALRLTEKLSKLKCISCHKYGGQITREMPLLPQSAAGPSQIPIRIISLNRTQCMCQTRFPWRIWHLSVVCSKDPLLIQFFCGSGNTSDWRWTLLSRP